MGVICVIRVSVAISMAVRTLQKKSASCEVCMLRVPSFVGRSRGVCTLGSMFHEFIHLDIKSTYSALASTLTRSLVVPFWYRITAAAEEVVKWTPTLGAVSDTIAPVSGTWCGVRTTRALARGSTTRSRPKNFILDGSDYKNVCKEKGKAQQQAAENEVGEAKLERATHEEAAAWKGRDREGAHLGSNGRRPPLFHSQVYEALKDIRPVP